MKLYDSFRQTKAPLIPETPNTITLYVCGVTVYDVCHVGHARVYLTFDILVRWLQAKGYTVRYARNITDIDDKIIQKAQQEGLTEALVAAHWTAKMHANFTQLGLLSPTYEPRATEYITQMCTLISTLLEKGFAYKGANGDVYFATAQYAEYGHLAHQDLSQLMQGARVEVDSNKRDPFDFVLWKRAKPGEPVWEAPFGTGRPGWHSECSAMAMDLLGQTIDIHGGGHDLIFPHHENERAQSECVTKRPFVNHWMHVGFVNVNQEKMSKSLNNFATIDSVLLRYHPDVLRMLSLQTHYKSPLQFNEEALVGAKRALDRLYNSIKISDCAFTIDKEAVAQFTAAMEDDLNTPEALAVLFSLANRTFQTGEDALIARATLKKLTSDIGLLQANPEEYFQYGASLSPSEIEHLIAERKTARAARDFAKADRIRKELEAKGIVLEDTGGETVWKVM